MITQVFIKDFFLLCYFKNMTSVQENKSNNAFEGEKGTSETMLVFRVLLEATCHAPIKEPIFFAESVLQSSMKYS